MDRAVPDGSPSSPLHRSEEISREAGTEWAMQSKSIPPSRPVHPALGCWVCRFILPSSRSPATPWSLCLPPHSSAPQLSLHSQHTLTCSAEQGQSLTTRLTIKNLLGISKREKKSLWAKKGHRLKGKATIDRVFLDAGIHWKRSN